jgi:hypothetical protein
MQILETRAGEDDRDLKIAKRSAAYARAEAQSVKAKQADELQKLRNELNAQHLLRLEEIQSEDKVVEQQLEKTTRQLRTLRLLHETLEEKKGTPETCPVGNFKT